MAATMVPAYLYDEARRRIGSMSPAWLNASNQQIYDEVLKNDTLFAVADPIRMAIKAAGYMDQGERVTGGMGMNEQTGQQTWASPEDKYNSQWAPGSMLPASGWTNSPDNPMRHTGQTWNGTQWSGPVLGWGQSAPASGPIPGGFDDELAALESQWQTNPSPEIQERIVMLRNAIAARNMEMNSPHEPIGFNDPGPGRLPGEAGAFAQFLREQWPHSGNVELANAARTMDDKALLRYAASFNDGRGANAWSQQAARLIGSQTQESSPWMWADASRGLAQPGQSYAQVNTPLNMNDPAEIARWNQQHPENMVVAANSGQPATSQTTATTGASTYNPEIMAFLNGLRASWPNSGNASLANAATTMNDQDLLKYAASFNTGAGANPWSAQAAKYTYGMTPEGQKEAYLASLPPPNKIVGRNFLRLDQDTRDFMLSGYENKGYSENQVLNSIGKTLPGSFAFGTSNLIPFGTVKR